MASFGISFIPGQNGESNGGPKRLSPAEQYQTAVRILSLRLPRVLGGSAIAPAPLLQASGAMGRSPIQDTFMRMAGLPSPNAAPQGQGPIRTPMAPMVPPPQGPMGAPRPTPPTSLPAPRIVPGITTHDPQVDAALQENRQTYNEAPNYGGVPGWTPPPSAPSAPVYTRPRRSYGKWNKDDVF